jgi:hypothetical protein
MEVSEDEEALLPAAVFHQRSALVHGKESREHSGNIRDKALALGLGRLVPDMPLREYGGRTHANEWCTKIPIKISHMFSSVQTMDAFLPILFPVRATLDGFYLILVDSNGEQPPDGAPPKSPGCDLRGVLRMPSTPFSTPPQDRSLPGDRSAESAKVGTKPRYP